MADNEQRPTKHYQARWKRAVADCKSTRDWLVRTLIATAVGAFVGSRMLLGSFSLVNVFISVVTAVVVAFLFFLYHWLKAPARIWTQDQKTIESLEKQLTQRDLSEITENKLSYQMGPSSRYLPDSKIKEAEKRIAAFEKEIRSGNRSHIAEINRLAKLLPDILAGAPRRSEAPIALRKRMEDLLVAAENLLSGKSSTDTKDP